MTSFRRRATPYTLLCPSLHKTVRVYVSSVRQSAITVSSLVVYDSLEHLFMEIISYLHHKHQNRTETICSIWSVHVLQSPFFWPRQNVWPRWTRLRNWVQGCLPLSEAQVCVTKTSRLTLTAGDTRTRPNPAQQFKQLIVCCGFFLNVE